MAAHQALPSLGFSRQELESVTPAPYSTELTLILLVSSGNVLGLWDTKTSQSGFIVLSFPLKTNKKR